MDLRQLRYFVSIVESGSITRAAESLRVAQPALSSHMKNLEEELGVLLLSRSVQGVKVTVPGELLYQHAKGILRQVDNTRMVLTQQIEQPSGKVSVGMPYSTAHLIAIDLMESLRSRYPGISLELIEGPSQELHGLVLHGRVELAVVVLDQPVRGLITSPLVREQLFVVRHPSLVTSAPVCSLQELASLPLVLINPPNIVRARLDQAFAVAGMDYQLVAAVNSTALLVSWVERGVGATVLPWSAVHEQVSSGSLVATPLDGPLWWRDLWLCHAETLPLTPAAGIVCKLILEQVTELVATRRWTGAEGTPVA